VSEKRQPANAGRDQAGRFRVGHSGNAAGKRPGTRNRASLLAEKMMVDEMPAVVEAVVAAAKAGDISAARLILDRIVPVRRGRTICVDIPTGSDAGSLMKSHATITEAVCSGQISAEEAEAMASVLDARRRAIETIELVNRVRRLETAMQENEHQEAAMKETK